MYADSMRDTFESWYVGGMTSLKVCPSISYPKHCPSRIMFVNRFKLGSLQEYMARQQAKQNCGKPKVVPSAPFFGRQGSTAGTAKTWIA